MYVFQPRHGIAFNRECCCIAFPSAPSWFYAQCPRKVVIQAEFEGEVRGFCKTHDPARVKAKEEARTARWKAESKAWQAAWDREEQKNVANEEARAALKEIASGAEKAQDIAKAALSLYPAKD